MLSLINLEGDVETRANTKSFVGIIRDREENIEVFPDGIFQRHATCKGFFFTRSGFGITVDLANPFQIIGDGMLRREIINELILLMGIPRRLAEEFDPKVYIEIPLTDVLVDDEVGIVVELTRADLAIRGHRYFDLEGRNNAWAGVCFLDELEGRRDLKISDALKRSAILEPRPLVEERLDEDFAIVGDRIFILSEEKRRAAIVIMIKLDALAKIAFALFAKIARLGFQGGVGVTGEGGECEQCGSEKGRRGGMFYHGMLSELCELL